MPNKVELLYCVQIHTQKSPLLWKLEKSVTKVWQNIQRYGKKIPVNNWHIANLGVYINRSTQGHTIVTFSVIVRT